MCGFLFQKFSQVPQIMRERKQQCFLSCRFENNNLPVFIFLHYRDTIKKLLEMTSTNFFQRICLIQLQLMKKPLNDWLFKTPAFKTVDMIGQTQHLVHNQDTMIGSTFKHSHGKNKFQLWTAGVHLLDALFGTWSSHNDREKWLPNSYTYVLTSKPRNGKCDEMNWSSTSDKENNYLLIGA